MFGLTLLVRNVRANDVCAVTTADDWDPASADDQEVASATGQP
jgi:hypothetical protein